jgi:hypothetical protein
VKQQAIAWALVRFHFRVTPSTWYRHAPLYLFHRAIWSGDFAPHME